MRIAIVLLVGLLVVGWVAKRVLLDSARVPQTSEFQLDLSDVRRLALSPSGSLPLRINSLLVGEGELPRAAVIAGASFDAHPMARTAYQVVTPDGSIIIDTTYDRVAHDESAAGKPYHSERWEELQRAMLAASTILVTHEHGDHIGGISRSPHLEELLPKLLLTREQLEPREQPPRFSEEQRKRIKPLEYARFHRVAPGVVLIKAPGHTPGTQIVFVRLDSGAEYLFVGDIAWHMDNITTLTGRPLFVTRFFLGEDRDAVLHQLRRLYEISRASEVQLVVSHDMDQLRQHLASGVLGAGFE